MRRHFCTTLLAISILASGCGGSDDASTDTDTTADTDTVVRETATAQDGSLDGVDDDQDFPNVIDATAVQAGDTWTFSATLSSPYDTAERYADAWRVVGPDNTEYGVRILDHDHAAEQPFTRSLNVSIPEGVSTVTIEGRDLANGWGGDTFELTLP